MLAFGPNDERWLQHSSRSERSHRVATKVDPQPTLWETILPPQFAPSTRARADRSPARRPVFSSRSRRSRSDVGRPSIPMETYLRMMFCASDIGSASRRCVPRSLIRSPGGASVASGSPIPWPVHADEDHHPLRDQAVDQLNQALLNKAKAAHVVKLDKVRADTTVVPANVAYPTDSGLLAKGVAKLTKTVRASEPRSGPADRLPRPHPVGAPSCPSDRRLAAPAQRRSQRRGARPDRRAGHHHRGRHQRRPGRGRKCPPEPSPCG